MLLSPLRSPDSYVCADYLKRLIPERSSIKTFLPFSGEVELSLIADGRDVLINTNNYVIYEFWSCFRSDPFRIADQAEELHTRCSPGMVKTFQSEWPAFRDPYLRSAIFFLLNRYSRTGTLSYGDVNMKNYTPMCLHGLRRCNESVTKIRIRYHKSEDYLQGLIDCSAEDTALLLGGRFSAGPLSRTFNMGYECYNINHRDLHNRLKGCSKNFILVYKSHPNILNLYKGYNSVHLNEFGQPTANPRLAHETIVTTLEIPKHNDI